MKYSIRVNTVFALTFFCFLIVKGGNDNNARQASELIFGVNKNYSSVINLSMDIEVKLYNDANTMAEKSIKGKMKKTKGMYYCDFMGRITLTNPRCILSVDRNNKFIAYSTNKQNNSIPENALLSIDSILKKNSSLELLSNSGKLAEVQVKPESELYEKIIFKIDPSRSVLLSVTYFFKPEADVSFPKMEIVYTNVSFETADMSVFSETKYVAIHKGKVSPSVEYKNYELLDQSKFDVNDYNKLVEY